MPWRRGMVLTVLGGLLSCLSCGIVVPGTSRRRGAELFALGWLLLLNSCGIVVPGTSWRRVKLCCAVVCCCAALDLPKSCSILDSSSRIRTLLRRKDFRCSRWTTDASAAARSVIGSWRSPAAAWIVIGGGPCLRVAGLARCAGCGASGLGSSGRFDGSVIGCGTCRVRGWKLGLRCRRSRY